MSKSIPQLTAQTSTTSGDLYHLVRSNIDYKIDYDDLAESIRGGANAETSYTAELVITSAQVLALNSTPIQIIPSPGAGKYIQIEHSSCKLTYNSTTYATNTSITLYTDTATRVQHSISSILNATVTRIGAGSPQAVSGATDTQLISDKAVYVSVASGNPTTGNSDIKIYVTYKIVTE